MARDAGDIDDAAFAASDHRRSEFLARQKNTANEVQIEIRLPVWQFDLVERTFGGHSDFWVVSPSGIHENCWRAERFFDRLMRRMQARPLHGISTEKCGLSALCLDAFYARLTAFLVASEHRHFCAGFPKAFRQGTAQGAGGADHHRQLTRQVEEFHS